tara:strand:+ start:627 stop:1280 length:654 start_codon:yes stop_codon:yes gene_type:complete
MKEARINGIIRKMKEAKIVGIFPTPVYISPLDRKLTSLELKLVEKNKKIFTKNAGNTTSANNYILNEKPFKKLKKELELRVKDYFQKIISSKNNITPYITQSWLNYTEKDQYHHKHAHPNSIISGVFYINCHESLDKITFFDEKYKAIKPKIKDFNLFNSESWWFPVTTGDIFLFPSSLAHMVETKQGKNTRISLSFNVFIKGTVGSDRDLTELILD